MADFANMVLQEAPTAVSLIVRQLNSNAAATSTAAAATTALVVCDSGNGYYDNLGVRISSIFVILVTSTFGAMFPTFARRHKGVDGFLPDWLFFFAKYFGSGVIVATAFIHLMAPASDALTSPCLSGVITEYDWAEGIALMTIFVLFFVEIMIMRYGNFTPPTSDGTFDSDSHAGHGHSLAKSNGADPGELALQQAAITGPNLKTPMRGEDHLGHSADHIANESDDEKTGGIRYDVAEGTSGDQLEDYSAQLTAIFVLEFGIIFHSVFIGLTLAVAGTTPDNDFVTLYIVLVFHQTFEGLGLGTRLAVTPWPKTYKWTPYVFGLAYGLTTPIAIAIGLGIRSTWAPGSPTATIVSGCFDSISAGILIYTGLVELMAHEFMFSPTMRTASIWTVLLAFGTMSLGAGLMALLGKWA